MPTRMLWGWVVCSFLVACGDTQRETVPPPTPPDIQEHAEPPPSSNTGCPDGGAPDASTPDAGAPDAGIASWPPEGSTPCGAVLACRGAFEQNGTCVEVHAPEHMSCSVSPSLPAGTCSDGACVISQAPHADWLWSVAPLHWKIAGLASDSSLLLSQMTSPDDRYLNEFISVCRLTRFDPAHPDHETVLHEGSGPCYPWVLHRRYALGTHWSNEAGRKMWTLVALDGSSPTRDVDLDAQLAARLATEGVTPTTQQPLWVQGAAGRLLLVWPVQGEKVWIGSLTLPGLEFAWTHRVTGTLHGTPIADESGRLYLPVDPMRVVSLSPEGAERWTVSEAGQPVAVFRDTLFLDDGTVRSTADGRTRYSWTASQASVQLSESHAAVIAPCGTSRCTRISLLKRATGEVLTEARLPDASPNSRPGDVTGLLTADGAVLITQTVWYPDLMTSPFYSYEGVRRFLVREGSPLKSLGETLEPTGQSVELHLLHNGQWVGIERDAYHNNPDPGANLIGVATPGLRPPDHGWLAPRGNLAGGSAPE